MLMLRGKVFFFFLQTSWQVYYMLSQWYFLQVYSQAQYVLKVASSSTANQETVEKLSSSEEALKFSTRLHLLSLLLEVSQYGCDVLFCFFLCNVRLGKSANLPFQAFHK